MSDDSGALTTAAELDLLRQGLATWPGSEAIIQAIAQAAREASLSPIGYLVCEGSLSRDVAQTLQAVRKGYMRVPLTTLLAGLRLPATLKTVVDHLAKQPSPDREREPERGDPGDMLGPLPEWNSIE
ncbi:MAG: hypothetical protein ACPG4T_12795, partial [Nannocystaceae bacterium]